MLSGAKTLTVVMFIIPAVVHAHAGLVKSVPGSRATLIHSPDHIELCFNEPIEPKFSSIKIHDQTGAAVPLGELKLADGPKCVQASAPPLSAGTYTVNYRVLSLDGHVVEYGYQFTMRPDESLLK
jgi:methionine-rich copper-binding protein CopC